MSGFVQEPDVQDVPSAPMLYVRPALLVCSPAAHHAHLLDAHRHIDETLGATVEFRDVRFRYPGQSANSGIKGVSFTVKAGTTTAVVGHTGAGKSTIARLLFRFYDVDQGQVLINGQNVSSVTQRSLRQQIGIVPQDTVLFNDTIGYNIKYGKPGSSDAQMREVTKARSGLLQVLHGWRTDCSLRRWLKFTTSCLGWTKGSTQWWASVA